MRFFDFLVFYPMASFQKRNVTGWDWQTSLNRAVTLAAISTSFLSLACLELIFFLALRINILDIWYNKFLFLGGGVLLVFLFNYIYVRKKRYEYIMSPQYKTFRLGITAGVITCFLIFILSMLLVIGIGIIQGNFLDKFK